MYYLLVLCAIIVLFSDVIAFSDICENIKSFCRKTPASSKSLKAVEYFSIWTVVFAGGTGGYIVAEVWRNSSGWGLLIDFIAVMLSFYTIKMQWRNGPEPNYAELEKLRYEVRDESFKELVGDITNPDTGEFFSTPSEFKNWKLKAAKAAKEK